MTRNINPEAYKQYVNWQYFNMAWRIRNQAIHRPRRERLLVRTALARLGVRYREMVGVVNRQLKGYKEGITEGIQFLDFVVQKPNGGIVVLLFHPYTGHGLKPYEKRLFQSKQDFLRRKNTPFIILTRSDTSQIYEVKIKRTFK